MSYSQGRRPLRICYFGTYRANYTRNQILLKGLRAQEGAEVYECHATLWYGIEDRVEQVPGGIRVSGVEPSKPIGSCSVPTIALQNMTLC